VTRQDGVKEKKAEFTLSRLHPLAAGAPSQPQPSRTAPPKAVPAAAAPAPTVPAAAAPPAPTWNASPLVPELGDDDIPF
jgi:hypothetical protein